MKRSLILAASLFVLSALSPKAGADSYETKMTKARRSLSSLMIQCPGTFVVGIEEIREGAIRVVLEHQSDESYECTAEAIYREIDNEAFISEMPCMINNGLSIGEGEGTAMTGVDLQCEVPCV